MDSRARIATGFASSHILAALLTSFRLAFRYRRGQLWWDDLYALVAAAATIFTAVTDIVKRFPPPGGLNEDVESFVVWSCFITQAIVIWSARMSLQATILHFLPPSRYRTMTKMGLIGLGLGLVGVLVANVFYCGVPVPKVPRAPYSVAPTVVGLTLNIISTLYLVSWPFTLLSSPSLGLLRRRSHRRLLAVAFSSAVILLAADLFHAANLLTKKYYLANVSGPLETLASILVANVLVLAGWGWKWLRTRRGRGGLGRGRGRGRERTSGDETTTDDEEEGEGEGRTRSRYFTTFETSQRKNPTTTTTTGLSSPTIQTSFQNGMTDSKAKSKSKASSKIRKKRRDKRGRSERDRGRVSTSEVGTLTVVYSTDQDFDFDLDFDEPRYAGYGGYEGEGQWAGLGDDEKAVHGPAPNASESESEAQIREKEQSNEDQEVEVQVGGKTKPGSGSGTAVDVDDERELRQAGLVVGGRAVVSHEGEKVDGRRSRDDERWKVDGEREWLDEEQRPNSELGEAESSGVLCEEEEGKENRNRRVGGMGEGLGEIRITKGNGIF